MNHYCTYFDKNFLPQGISLYNSLLKTEKDSFILYILALDSYTQFIIESLNYYNIVIVNEDDLLKFEKRLIK